MRLLLTLAMAWAARAGTPVPRGEFRTLPNGHTLWVEAEPAASGHPTLILANGLTFTTRDYDALANHLRRLAPGLGLVRYDMRGMGKTMLRAPRDYEDISIEDQAEDLKALSDDVAPGARVVLAGLSYGGATALTTAATYPDAVAEVIALAPLLGPLPEFTRIIERLVAQHRLWQPLWRPFDHRTRDELFDHYSRQLVFTTYPMAEPIVREDWPHKLEHIARLVKGSKTWRANDLSSRLPEKRTHFVLAESDEYVPIAMSRGYAATLTPDRIGSILYVRNAKHKLTQVAPELMARWILRIVYGDSKTKAGLTYRLDARESAECEPLLLDRT